MIRLLAASLLVLLTAAACATQGENERLVEALARGDVHAIVTVRGVVALVPDVLFEFDSHGLSADAERRVASMAAVILEFGTVRPIQVEGHTDSVGDSAYNLELSFRRAERVARALVEAGIDPLRVTSLGLGETRPVAPDQVEDGRDNPAGRRLNRRVEVVIENR